ncbi:hypothetical protein GU243_06100 [Pseudarthrobacter psychrotolerans]|uniref:Uncharacterized protein n=1 Tax=Pseudarthrobacter psychrotolerans TaxID=2697569 RepID=A0A6P1NLI9_9MICC|nr:hypothetical protein [Pseudarthrobacter psychrotolerans]QHK19384.1 hypothetical protein GU243_06100 [Pseudarthrobacter psychrotolerans]
MTSLNETPHADEVASPEELEAAITQFADRCYALPPSKQHFLLATLAQRPAIHIDTFAILLIMLESSDDGFNINDPELNRMVEHALTRHTPQEPA